MEKKLEQLCNIIKSLDDINQEFYNEVQALSKDNERLESENQDFKQKQDEINNNVKRFTELIDLNEKKKLELEKREEQFDTEKASAVQKAVNDAKKSVEDEKGKIISGLQDNIRTLEGENFQLDTKLKNATTKINQRQATIDTLNDKVTDLKNQLRQCQKDLEDANGKNSKLETTNKANGITISGKDREIAELNTQISDLKQQNSELTQQVDELKQQDDGYKAYHLIEKMKNQLSDKENQLLEKTNRIETLSDLRKDADKKLKVLTDYLYKHDKWKDGDVERIIKEELQKSASMESSNFFQSSNQQNDNRFGNYNPIDIKKGGK